MDVGRIVADAVAGPDAVAALAAAGLKPDHLRQAASAASRGANVSRPRIHAGMDAGTATQVLKRHQKHSGKSVAALLAQLARDLEVGSTTSTGVEWDATHKVTLETGERVVHPVIRRHGLFDAIGVPRHGPLLLLDADADLEANRHLFGGGDLRALTIPAVRQAYTIQISDCALAKSSLAPDDQRLRNDLGKAEKLRRRLGEMVRREAAGGRKVLVITPLKARRAFTGEEGFRLEISTEWQGATLTHFGRHLGSNAWADFDTVIIIGREELPPLTAERIARAIWADAPDVTLNLTGEYTKELRAHDLRQGSAAPVKVRVHPDPRVQAVVEMARECAIAQGIDRLRLIHRRRDKPARVIVVTNLPVPGLVVDRLMTLDDLLDGGTVWERVVARMPNGVLPLAPEWLISALPDLFGSSRTAEREVANLKPPNGNKSPYCGLAVLNSTLQGAAGYCLATYRTAGQRRPSNALVRTDAVDPAAELARILDAEIVEFSGFDEEGESLPVVTEQPRINPHRFYPNAPIALVRQPPRQDASPGSWIMATGQLPMATGPP